MSFEDVLVWDTREGKMVGRELADTEEDRYLALEYTGYKDAYGNKVYDGDKISVVRNHPAPLSLEIFSGVVNKIGSMVFLDTGYSSFVLRPGLVDNISRVGSSYELSGNT